MRVHVDSEGSKGKEGRRECVCLCVWWVRGEILFEAKKGRRERERGRLTITLNLYCLLSP